MNALAIVITTNIIAILTSAVYSNYHARLTKNKISRDFEISMLLKEMLSIERDYFKLCEHVNLNKYNRVNEYIMQNTHFLNTKLDIDLNNIIIEEAKYGEGEFGEFLKQLSDAPEELKQLVFRKNATVEKVIRLKRPCYFKVMCLKKSIALKILSVLLDILKFIVKHRPDNKSIVAKQELWVDSDIIINRVNDINNVDFG